MDEKMDEKLNKENEEIEEAAESEDDVQELSDDDLDDVSAGGASPYVKKKITKTLLKKIF